MFGSGKLRHQPGWALPLQPPRCQRADEGCEGRAADPGEAIGVPLIAGKAPALAVERKRQQILAPMGAAVIVSELGPVFVHQIGGSAATLDGGPTFVAMAIRVGAGGATAGTGTAQGGLAGRGG